MKSRSESSDQSVSHPPSPVSFIIPPSTNLVDTGDIDEQTILGKRRSEVVSVPQIPEDDEMLRVEIFERGYCSIRKSLEESMVGKRFERLAPLPEKIENPFIRVFVCGRSKSGKSSFVNSLLGKIVGKKVRICPVSRRTFTSCLWRVKYGDIPMVCEYSFNSGERILVRKEHLTNKVDEDRKILEKIQRDIRFSQKMEKHSSMCHHIDEVEVIVNYPQIKNFEFVDSPGLGESVKLEKMVIEEIVKSDFIFYVVDSEKRTAQVEDTAYLHKAKKKVYEVHGETFDLNSRLYIIYSKIDAVVEENVDKYTKEEEEEQEGEQEEDEELEPEEQKKYILVQNLRREINVEIKANVSFLDSQGIKVPLERFFPTYCGDKIVKELWLKKLYKLFLDEVYSLFGEFRQLRFENCVMPYLKQLNSTILSTIQDIQKVSAGLVALKNSFDTVAKNSRDMALKSFEKRMWELLSEEGMERMKKDVCSRRIDEDIRKEYLTLGLDFGAKEVILSHMTSSLETEFQRISNEVLKDFGRNISHFCEHDVGLNEMRVEVSEKVMQSHRSRFHRSQLFGHSGAGAASTLGGAAIGSTVGGTVGGLTGGVFGGGVFSVPAALVFGGVGAAVGGVVGGGVGLASYGIGVGFKALFYKNWDYDDIEYKDEVFEHLWKNVTKSEEIQLSVSKKKFELKVNDYFEFAKKKYHERVKEITDFENLKIPEEKVDTLKEFFINKEIDVLNLEYDTVWKVRVTESYTTKNEIGNGSYGKVYRQTLKREGRRIDVATKVVGLPLDLESPHHFKKKLEWKENVKNEIHIHNIASHLNLEKVVPIIFCTFDENKCVCKITMPLYDESVLERLIRFKSSDNVPIISEYQKLNIMKQVVRGVGMLHKNKLIYRDLKPANLLIEKVEDKKDGRIDICICDLGYSKLLISDMTFSLAGSPYYADKIVVLSRCGYGYEYDIYSLGITMAQIWEQQVDVVKEEFLVMKDLQAVTEQMESGYCPLKHLTPFNLPEFNKLENLIRRCVSLDKNLRPKIDEIEILINDLLEGLL